MVIISLLNLPMELPPNSKARIEGDETFLTGLPEYLSRCGSSLSPDLVNVRANIIQVRRSRAA